jgi:hypothetical protein
MKSKIPIPLPTTFTQHFGLKIEQSNLTFLDIYADRDIPLFLDPYGISAMGTKWAKDCETEIATYFQCLVDVLKVGDQRTASRLLHALHEVDEVALGFSQNHPQGRGIGPLQAKEIQNAFESSQAARSGDIKDIADCALMIPGINRDKISDITANILKKQLIKFTQEQCKIHGIPMKKVPINNVFDHTSLTFTSYYDELPVINGKPKILLPLHSVRHDPELSKDKYYRKFVLEFLKAEHEHAGDALATVLKNGRIVVRIKDLKKAYPIGTDFLYKFSKEHPKILEKYKSELQVSAIKKRNIENLTPPRTILTANKRLEYLRDIQPGNDDADKFHKLSYDNLIQIVGDRLSNPSGEVKINGGRKRIDIVFDNTGQKGFFHSLYTLHQVKCPKIFFECKNYGREIGNPEIDQLIGRFSKHRGDFGILLCRSIVDRKLSIERCKDVMHSGKGLIIVLDDNDIAALLNYREAQSEEGIDSFLSQKLDEIIM